MPYCLEIFGLQLRLYEPVTYIPRGCLKVQLGEIIKNCKMRASQSCKSKASGIATTLVICLSLSLRVLGMLKTPPFGS